MKNLFKKSLQVLIGVLITSLTTQMWAGTRTVYCNWSSVDWWDDGGAKMCVYAWGSSSLSAASFEMTSAGTNLLSYNLDDSYTSICFFRGPEVNISKKYNQTVDISISSNNYWNIDNSTTDSKQNVSGACRYAPNGAIVGLDGDWNAHKHPMSAGSVSITLEANTTYTFKVLKDFTYYNQSKAYVGQTSALRWTSDGDVACHLTTAGAGSYIFTWDNTNKDLTVTYPTVTHPTTDYVYFKKPGGWGGTIYGHIYTGESPVVTWGNKPDLSTCSFDGSPYYYAALGGKSSIIFTDGSNETAGLTTASSNKGKYWDQTLGTPAWADFKATITLNNHDADIESGTTSVNPVYKTEVLSSITPPQKTNYTFDGYYTGTSGSGSKLINKSGAWQTVAGYTDASKHWIRNSAGSSSITLHANWTQDPAVTITASKTSGINVGETITLTATGSQASNITKYEFYEGSTKKGEVTTSSGSANYSYTPSTVGAKTVKVVMTYNSGSNTVESDGLDLTLNTPAVALGESSSRTEMWLGVNATNDMTLNATSSNVGSSASVTWTISDAASGTFTQTGAGSYSGKGWTYVPASTGAKTITVTMAVGGQEYTRTYNVTVYERWNIYVHDVQSWGKMSIYSHTSEAHGSWPGTACSKYNSTNSWYTVTLDSKGTKTILNKNGEKDGGNDVKAAEITTGSSSGTYASGTYWYINAFNNGTLTSVSISEPEVEITNCNVYATYALLEGRVTGFGGDGSALSDLKEYGFYLDETKYSGASYVKSTSGTYFRVKISGLTPGTEYAIKAFATNVLYTAYSDVQNKTTSDDSRTIGIRYKDNTNQTLKIYAYRNISSDYGTETKENATWSGEALSRISGTARWWEATISNAADYQYFIISNNGSNQSDDTPMPNADACWWYDDSKDNSSGNKRLGSMDCTPTTPQLYIEETAEAGDYQYLALTGSGTMTRAVSLAAKSTYEFKIVYQAEYWGKNSGTYSRGSSAITGVQDDGYIQITTDAAGDYTFNFNTSTKAISITYPEAYVVTYSAVTIGTGDGESDDPSAEAEGGIAVTSTDYVLAGKDVTFTAAAANAYYTFQGWFDTDEPTIGTTEPLTTDAEYTAKDIAADVTVYAVYTEDMNTVTVTADEHGTITTPDGGSGSTIQAGAYSAADIVAAEKSGYRFINWTKVSGDGKVTFGNASNKSTNVKAEGGDATIRANFSSNWCIGGKGEPFGDWDTEKVVSFTNFTTAAGTTTGYVDFNLDANVDTFELKVRYLVGDVWCGSDGDMTITYADDNVAKTIHKGGKYNNIKFKTAGKGTYRFTLTITASDTTLTIDYPTSYTVTYGRKTFYNDDATNDSTNTGGSITSIVDNDSNPVAYGKYVVGTGSVTVTVAPVAGYEVLWYSDASYSTPYTNGTGGVTISGEGGSVFSITPLTTNTGIYAKFKEKMTTVKIVANYQYGGNSVTAGEYTINSNYDNPHRWGQDGFKVGVHTGLDLEANAGPYYYFSSWSVPDGADFSLTYTDEDHPSVTMHGLGGGEDDQTLTVMYGDLEPIYFDNELDGSWPTEKLWDVNTIYAYFNVSWIDGSGYGGTAGVGNHTTSEIKCIELTPLSGTTYMGYVPRSVSRAQGNGTINVAFSDVWMGTGTYPDGTQWEKFFGNKGVFRGDYNKKQSEFVPYHVKSGTSNSTDYYSDGYWRVPFIKASESIGYYIKDNNNTEVNLGEFKGVEDYASIGEVSVRVDYTSSKTLYIVSAGGEYYKLVNDEHITSTNYTRLKMESGGDSKAGFTFEPSNEGYYTFQIRMYGDQMELSVEYPVGPGDYRLEHTYNSGAKKTHSDIIKQSKATTKRRHSMYLNNSGSPTLKLQKCASINKTTLLPVWEDVSTANLSDITTALSTNGNGVYQFDLSIDTENHEVKAGSVDSVRLYDGPIYIKTDATDGGWASYKENPMSKNTINFKTSDSKTFDYFYCVWIGSDETNVKCVIANDYNTELSDTLKADAILTASEPSLHNGNVRFSYNSYTNEVKRAYINGSSAYHEKFLWLEGYNSKVDADPSADGIQANNKFADKGNWTYMLDIKAKETARVRLTAKFGDVSTGAVQSLIGDKDGELSTSNTVEILGGSSSSDTWNDIRLIYDFKTNHLMSAWLVPSSGDTESKAINTDVLIIRENQGDARQITFGKEDETKKLSEVDTVYAALCLTKAWLLDGSGSYEADNYSRRAFYWVSFPFDVKVSDIFGSAGTFGYDWIVQTYNGKRRAEKGYWIDSESNWDFMNFTDTLKAGYGYVVTLDLSEFAEYSSKWNNSVTEVYLYFPSIGKVGNITEDNRSIDLGNPDDYECKIKRNSRNVYDSYWHCIGAPSFAEVIRHANDPRPSWYDEGNGDLPDSVKNWTTELLFVYDYVASEAYLQPKFYNSGGGDFTFKPMHSYLVQYKQRNINWTSVITPKASVVARRERQTNEINNITFRLELSNGTTMQDQAFIHMSDDDAITNRYDFNYDLAKESNSGRVNLWTVTADTIKVAANCQPLSNQTTIIPVGVQTTTAGDYTFSIPEGTNGVGIVLVDNVTGARTNLGLTDYTVTMAQGAIEGRFVLEISPISQTATGIEYTTGAGIQDGISKCIIDGIMYIIKDGVIYDARGARVQ